MIKEIVLQQREERDALLAEQYIPRVGDAEITGYLSTNLIKLITGPRRAGKSVLALQMLKSVSFAYLNFDDDMLLKHFDEDLVVQSLYEVYEGHQYILLDEIQNLPSWELWVSKLYRRGSNLFITGSNAKLLSHEMASSLTGRFIQMEVYPFSFQEVMKHHSMRWDESSMLSPSAKGKTLSLLSDYMQNGGFPEIVMNPSIIRSYLSTLFDSILLKDILKRFRIRQTQQLYDLSHYLLANYTNPYTANQVKEYLNFNSVATVQKFVGYLEEPYLILHLARYATKIRVQNNSPRKAYIIDTGFVKARSFELSPNYGRLLENLVFVELLRRNHTPGLELFYFKTRNDREVDFLCRKGHSVVQLIQVCYQITNTKTLNRELDALVEASEELNCNNLLLITWDTEEITQRKGVDIQLIPAYKWLMGGDYL